MGLKQSNKHFHPITKQMIAKMGVHVDVDELCGVASVAMLLQWNGQGISFGNVLNKMSSSGAYEEGVGTYLKYTARIFPNMHYIRYIPYPLMRFLNAVGEYTFISSIKRDNGSNHIVFVYKCDRTHVYYYDPNMNEVAQTMPYGKWNTVSNKRAVILKNL